MPRLSWGRVGNRIYEDGLDRGVLQVVGKEPVVWDGLVAFDEGSDGGEVTSYYSDGIKYNMSSSVEEFGGRLSAIFSPKEFDLCDGMLEIANGLYASYQNRLPFNLSYRTMIGNDVDGTDFGYKLHLLYNVTATTVSKTYSTETSNPDLDPLEWDLVTTPIETEYGVVSSHFVIDSREIQPEFLKFVEDMLYGTDTTAPRFPYPEDVHGVYDAITEPIAEFF